MSLYESEHTRFMREFLDKHPEELEEKAAGRGLWWDKPARTPEQMAREREARVPLKPYYYDAN